VGDTYFPSNARGELHQLWHKPINVSNGIMLTIVWFYGPRAEGASGASGSLAHTSCSTIMCPNGR